MKTKVPAKGPFSSTEIGTEPLTLLRKHTGASLQFFETSLIS